ncbi:hypothetical protein D3C85_1456280 [compost metagenome]
MGEAGLRQQGRQLHATGFEVTAGIEKAGLKEGIHRRLNLGNQHGFAIFKTRLVLIAFAVVRGEVLFGDGPRGGQGGVEGFAVVLGKARALGQGLGVEHFVEFEGQVAGAEQSLGHGGIPVWGWAESR